MKQLSEKAKKFNIVYSQFLNIDIEPDIKNKGRFEKVSLEVFEKWVLDNKNIQIKFKDYWLGLEQLTNLIYEYSRKVLDKKGYGWEIQNYSIPEGWVLTEDDNGARFYNQEGKEFIENGFCKFKEVKE